MSHKKNISQTRRFIIWYILQFFEMMMKIWWNLSLSLNIYCFLWLICYYNSCLENILGLWVLYLFIIFLELAVAELFHLVLVCIFRLYAIIVNTGKWENNIAGPTLSDQNITEVSIVWAWSIHLKWLLWFSLWSL